MIAFFGRLHPLLVHLPIGILMLAFGLECLARWRDRNDLRPAIRLALVAGAISALLTAGSGWLLSQQGGYDGDLLRQHQWSGFVAAALSALVWWGQARRWYFPAFTGAVLVLALAGHFGGSLTHGENYLFETANNPADTPQAVPAPLNPEAPVFAGLVQPVLKNKCQSCHNASKQKGGLRLDTPEFIRKGGKHGAVVEPGRPKDSPLLRRIHLPQPDDDHMPPAGKPQLTDAEIRLLEWWIAQGADFQVKIRDAGLPEDLKAAFEGGGKAAENPVFALAVDAAPASDLQRLKALFIHVSPLGTDVPWLAVSFAGQNQLTAAQWTALKKVRAQVVDLDLAHTGAKDADLAEFPHLVRLDLAHTAVTDGLRTALAKMPYLESLNLTGTAVTDAVLAPLAQMPQLKRLYVWQTAISAGAVAQLKQQNPGLQVETGATPADTARLALRTPKLLYVRSFFDDTMHVALDYPSFKGVSLYYTLDEAASPTSQSARYRDPIVLDRTAHVRAVAMKDGWLPSPVADAIFVRKRYTPAGVRLAAPPSPKYPAKGAPSLIDGKIAGEQGADTWLGYEGEHLTATLDLGAPREISRVFIHCLENNNSWIFNPTGLQVYTAADGKTFQPRASRTFPVNTAMGEQKASLLSCDLPRPETARYVRVYVKSLLKNPTWHPGKGQKCWIFVDELMVE